ncbi:MAG: hypothetical protein PHY93_05800 [Bacteriovorax sp.]|nr:hypothetical protein [Bacteriovorax sp.]
MNAISFIELLTLSLFSEKKKTKKHFLIKFNISLNKKNEVIEIDFNLVSDEDINELVNNLKNTYNSNLIEKIGIELIEFYDDVHRDNGIVLENHYFASYVKNKLEMFQGSVVEDNHTAGGRAPLPAYVKYKDFKDAIIKFNLPIKT